MSPCPTRDELARTCITRTSTALVESAPLGNTVFGASSAGRVPDAQLKVALDEEVIVNVNEPVCPLIE